jgi:UDP-N-acetylglucosamine acyltransferase
MESNNPSIHPTAIIHPKAQIGAGTQVGAFSIIGENVILGDHCEIHEHVVIKGNTRVGKSAKIFPFAVIGMEPQHLKYNGAPTTVEIGDNVIIREAVTIHRGTEFGGGKTVVADGSFLMAYTHVAHDCYVGKSAIVCNAVQLAGHVVLEDYVTIGGASEVAQFCRVGRYCYVGGGSTLRKDLPPFLVGKDNEFKVQGINVVGLERHGFSPSTIQRLKALYKIFYLQNLTVNQAIEKVLAEVGHGDEVTLFIDFIKTSKVGFIR